MLSLDKNNSLIGIFPLTYNLAETGRSILVAKKIQEMGGNLIFFTHGGKYEYLIDNFGFKKIRIKPYYTDEIVNQIIKSNRGEIKKLPYHLEFLIKAVENEVEIFGKTNVSVIVSFVENTCFLSTRVAKIPHIKVIPCEGRFHYRIPDNFETIFTRLLPQFIKIRILNKYFGKGNKKELRLFNEVANKFNLKSFSNFNELLKADLTVSTDFLEVINIFPNQQFHPKEDYVGAILLEKLFKDIFKEENSEQINKRIKNHINKNNKKAIFITMGSSGDKEFFLRILNALNNKDYNVIAVYGNIISDDEASSFNENILLEKFVPSTIFIHKNVDLSVIHGGHGTVYSAIYSGKPIIGFPMQFEQHIHLEKIQGHGLGYMLSRRFFKEKDFLNIVEHMFRNYDYYYTNAQNLLSKLPPPEGDKNAAIRILNFIDNLQILAKKLPKSQGDKNTAARIDDTIENIR